MEKSAFDARYQEYLKAIEEYLNGLFAEKPLGGPVRGHALQFALRRQAAPPGDDP